MVFEIFVNVADIGVPSLVNAVIAIMLKRAAIRPYSIIVAPDWSLIKSVSLSLIPGSFQFSCFDTQPHLTTDEVRSDATHCDDSRHANEAAAVLKSAAASLKTLR